MKTSITSLLAIAIAATACSGTAYARPKKHHVVETTVDAQGDAGQIPLTVNRRSWLDPGPVAPRGTGNKYVTANTGEFIRTPDQNIDPDEFGNAELPGQPYVPGRSFPTVEFSTTPNGHVDVANELLPQNFYFNPTPPVPPPNYRPSFSLEQP